MFQSRVLQVTLHQAILFSESDTTSLSRYKQKQDTIANGTRREIFLRAKEAITESSKTESSKTRDNYSATASTYKSGVCADKQERS